VTPSQQRFREMGTDEPRTAGNQVRPQFGEVFLTIRVEDKPPGSRFARCCHARALPEGLNTVPYVIRTV
jgi:hypothetical protein